MVMSEGGVEMASPIKVPIAYNLMVHDNLPGRETVSVAGILAECKTSLIADWLTRATRTPELNHLDLSDEERTGHLPKLVEDLIERLGKPKLPDKDSEAVASPAAIEHGKLRRTQGYSPGMLIDESRILQVTIFGTLHKNLGMLDFNSLLPDVMIIADEVDAQLTQTMESFANGASKSAKTKPVKPTTGRPR
jgi:RsbT co-antagonist protein rsbRD N-terminal domain